MDIITFVTPVKYVLLFLLLLVAGYIVFRVLTFAGFMSYFQAKHIFTKSKSKGEQNGRSK